MAQFPMIIGHRGVCRAAPENTLPSFQKAIDIGCDAIELDVNLTKDDKVIVIHDDTINRTTNGEGHVRNYTLSELQNFDAGSYFSKEYAGTKLPTLEEVFQLIMPTKLKIITELKGECPGLEEKVVELIHKYKFEDRVVVSSYHHNYLLRVKEIEPKITTELDIFFTLENVVKLAKSAKADILCPSHNFVEAMGKWRVLKLRYNNIKLNTYTVDTEGEMFDMIKIGVDGIMTNHPELLIQLKNGYKPKKTFFLLRFLSNIFHR